MPRISNFLEKKNNNDHFLDEMIISPGDDYNEKFRELIDMEKEMKEKYYQMMQENQLLKIEVEKGRIFIGFLAFISLSLFLIICGIFCIKLFNSYSEIPIGSVDVSTAY